MARRLLLLLAVGSTACTYVTRGVFEDKRDRLDEDADGAPWSTDCDDQDAARSPEMAEVPYDAIDNDCGGDGDLIDVDGDGFPGVDPETYAGEIPERYAGKEMDCADDPATLPEAASIFPDPTGENAIEVPYDGLDSDCDRGNDFDDDGDGWMPTTVQGVDIETAFAEYLDRWQITESEASAWIAATGKDLGDPLIFQDCDDLDPDIRPESPDLDAPYDGIDRNCDDRNDFDADGDGFMPPGVESDFDAYVAEYYAGQTPPFAVPAERAFEDCLDVANPIIDAAPEDVHPDVKGHPVDETPYDGVDTDCNRDNDFDDDGDGFMPDEATQGDYEDYVAHWQITPDEEAAWAAANPDAGLSEPAFGDCDDAAPDIWPGALEVLGDLVDQDCDDAVDQAAFGFGGFTWTLPTNPEVGRVDDTYLLLIGASSAQLATPITELGVGVPFTLQDARGGSAPSATTYPTWKGNPTTFLQGVIDAAPDPQPEDVDGDGAADPTLYIGTSYANAIQSWVYLSGIRYQTMTGVLLPPASTFHNLSPVYAASDVDLVFDGDGEPFTLACATDRLHALHTDESPSHNTASLSGDGASVCYFTGEPVPTPDQEVDFDACNGACESWTLTDQPALFDNGPSGESWAFGDYEMGWLARIDAAGAGVVTDTTGASPDIQVMPGETVVWVDVSEHAGTVYVASVVDAGGTREVWLQYGSGTSFDSQQLPFSNPSFPGALPSSVAVHADGDRIVVAATALDPAAQPGYDTVGWVFLGPP